MRMKILSISDELTEGTMALEVLPVLPDGNDGGLGMGVIPTKDGQPTDNGLRIYVEFDSREAKTIYDYIAARLPASIAARNR